MLDKVREITTKNCLAYRHVDNPILVRFLQNRRYLIQGGFGPFCSSICMRNRLNEYNKIEIPGTDEALHQSKKIGNA